MQVLTAGWHQGLVHVQGHSKRTLNVVESDAAFRTIEWPGPSHRLSHAWLRPTEVRQSVHVIGSSCVFMRPTIGKAAAGYR